MSFSAPAVKVMDRVQTRYAKAAQKDGQPFGIIPLVELIPVLLEAAKAFASILAACKKPVPPTPPTPPALAAVGVTDETWNQAFVSKYGATQADDGSGGFHPIAIRRTKVQIAKSQHIKKKAALPLAMSALESGRDETVEDLAVALQDAKRNAASFGVSL